MEQQSESPFEALDPDKFARDLAEKINVLMRDPEPRKRFGQAGRKRAIEKFSWRTIALTTKQMYADLVEKNERARIVAGRARGRCERTD